SRPVIRNRMGFQSRERNRESTGKGAEIRGDKYIFPKLKDMGIERHQSTPRISAPGHSNSHSTSLMQRISK
ncbi:MAG: hypothetical protein OXD45_11140, partial [Rhodobacteraceae bacterium]|nr:hypothetical protein [Paracoccaceae bacterium]